MRGSTKGGPPALFAEWVRENIPLGPVRFDSLPGAVKQALKAELAREQRGSCIYCGKRLNLSAFPVQHHVEHFRPRSSYPQFEVDYENLFLSCGPSQITGSYSSNCGAQKADWFSEDLALYPDRIECLQHFRFSALGLVVCDPGDDPALTMISILNLNSKELVKDRSDFLELLEAELMESSREEVLESFESIDRAGFEKSLSYVAISWLQEQF